MEKKIAVQDSADTVAFKDASRRLQSHLAAAGIKLTHAQALEALTSSLGAANWRTLRAKLNAKVSAASGWNPKEPRWTVHAVYTDNDQRYSDYFSGATPLEAQINAQVERLSDAGWITNIAVTCVVDRTTGLVADTESFVEESELFKVSECIQKLCRMAHDRLMRLAPRETDPNDVLAYEFWAHFYASCEHLCEAEELDEMLTSYDAHDSRKPPKPAYLVGGAECDIDVADALKRLAALAAQGLDLTNTDDARETGVFHVLQAQAMVEYFSDALRYTLEELEVSMS